MANNESNTKEGKKKSFFAKLFDRLDKKLEEKAKSESCCCKPSDKGDSSCCS
ncbi:MAG: hypothetical protein NTV71_02500 [Candidatus Omnitrophica bacterium]|nr:hypothetical protein [Candidatus Omnitrophota bacterium]